MPPEQLPWDRRDFRKHERSASEQRFGGGGFGGGGPHRWREQHHHTHGPPAPPPHPPPYHHHNNQQQQQQQRWYSDFRSSRPVPSDDAGPGFMPFGSRYGDRHIEDDNFQSLGSRNDGRYFRNNRENRGSFNQKDWRSPSWEPAATSSGPGRPAADVGNPKPVANSEIWHNSKSNDSSHHPLPTSSQSLSLMKEQERNDCTPNVGDSSCQKSEKESGLESVDWKPLKWTRSGSLPSRGPSFSQLSGAKSAGADAIETMVEVQLKSAVPVQSPSSSNAKSSVPASREEIASRKKPRLGWGEGLAKYEKKKVEGPEDGVAKDGLIVSITAAETVQSPSVNLSDKSPRVAGTSGCASPATPSSFACSSSPGIEEKESIRPANTDQENVNLSSSPCITSKMHHDGPTFNLESIDLTSIVKLSSLINDLLQSEDPSSGEADCAQTTSMRKLLVWKVDILKALEVTESEIDLLETELKSLRAEPSSCFECPATSGLLPGEFPLKPSEEQATVSAFTVEPAPLPGGSIGSMNVETMPAAVKEEREALKNEGIDSPGSAPITISEPLPVEDVNLPDTAECKGFVNLDSSNSSNLNLLCIENGLNNEINSSHVDLSELIKDSCQHANVEHVHCGRNRGYDCILASNKDTASCTSEDLNKLLPSGHCSFDISVASNESSLGRNSSRIKEKFLVRKRSLKFKEKVITLKFRVFHHFWKEGRMVSVKKLRGKSHKMSDMSQSGHKKYRTSSRSRISYFAWNNQTVSAEEVIKFINGLLSESAFKPCRSTLKMPALILDKGTKMSTFVSSNGLVEDPCAAEKERSIINSWTADEREVFIDKLATFGKNFRKISSFLEHKTIADCIEFYYKNHKSECFARARKKSEFSEQRKPQNTTYLVATGKRWNREVNAASLNILGEAPRRDNGSLRRSNSLEIYSNETVAADVLAGICGSLSSEAVNSCIPTSFDNADGYKDWKYARVGSGSKRPVTPDRTPNGDDECSDDSCEELDSADWTEEEKSNFVQAMSSYGKDFDVIAHLVRTKSKDQCKIFFSKARKCLGLDQIHPGSVHAVSGVANGGGSDTEDGCVVQTDSIIVDDNGPVIKSEADLSIAAATCENNKHRTNPILESSSMDDKQIANHGASSEGKSDGVIFSAPDSAKGTLADSDFAGSCRGENDVKDYMLHVDSGTKEVEDTDADPAEFTANTSPRTEMTSDPKPAGNVCSMKEAESGSRKESSEKPTSNVCLTLMESTMIFSVPISTFQRRLNNNSSSNVAGGITENKSPETVPLWDTVDSPQILRAREIGGDVSFKRNAVQHAPRLDGNTMQQQSNQASDFSIQKCSTKDGSGSGLGCSSDLDKPSRNGDVKLFGKVLISSKQKPNSSYAEETCSNNKARCQSLNLRFSTEDQKAATLDHSTTMFGRNEFIGSENVPVRSCSLPDTGMSFPKYPAVSYANHSKLEVQGNECAPMNGGVPILPSSSNGIASYQNRDKDVDVDVLFSEMRRFDAAMQQEARGMIGIGVVGIPDPVKMQQYSKSHNISLAQTQPAVRDNKDAAAAGDEHNNKNNNSSSR
ncbi:uncharacterized protein LOC127241525 isoform X2 [Andrographis paniculata]|uniref:uncharacterized protein LOC127241525 isoform X2 n=1 Tax=Andrographis paniculata TaxID=175694 RepID=UPI0021E70D06|nr:uncharacterized protein LOC127241525 isoform X2 [Andrographis paniculata]